MSKHRHLTEEEVTLVRPRRFFLAPKKPPTEPLSIPTWHDFGGHLRFRMDEVSRIFGYVVGLDVVGG